MLNRRPSNEQVKDHRFNDPIIDDMTDYDFYARASYIAKEISRDDYLSIERAREAVKRELKHLSLKGINCLREVLSGV